MFDFDKLGKKALIAPFVLVIALCCVLCLAVAPLLRTDPHDISLAIVNLDNASTTTACSAASSSRPTSPRDNLPPQAIQPTSRS